MPLFTPATVLLLQRLSHVPHAGGEVADCLGEILVRHFPFRVRVQYRAVEVPDGHLQLGAFTSSSFPCRVLDEVP